MAHHESGLELVREASSSRSLTAFVTSDLAAGPFVAEGPCSKSASARPCRALQRNDWHVSRPTVEVTCQRELITGLSGDPPGCNRGCGYEEGPHRASVRQKKGAIGTGGGVGGSPSRSGKAAFGGTARGSRSMSTSVARTSSPATAAISATSCASATSRSAA
jgi:hypothetical protein